MTNDDRTDTDRELSDADLEAVTGGKSQGVIHDSSPSFDGSRTVSHSYQWRGRRFAPWLW